MYKLLPQASLLKDRVKKLDTDERVHKNVAKIRMRATVKKELILFWHTRSRWYRIPRWQSQNPASAP